MCCNVPGSPALPAHPTHSHLKVPCHSASRSQSFRLLTMLTAPGQPWQSLPTFSGNLSGLGILSLLLESSMLCPTWAFLGCLPAIYRISCQYFPFLFMEESHWSWISISCCKHQAASPSTALGTRCSKASSASWALWYRSASWHTE